MSKSEKGKKIKVVLILRFLHYYRVDLLERISAHENLDFTFVYGKDFPKSKFRNYTGDVNFKKVQLSTLKYGIEDKAKYLVYWPFLFFQLVKLRPEVVVYEGESNILNNKAVYLYSLLFRKKLVWWGLGLIPGFSVTLWQKIYRPFKKFLLRKSKYVIGYSEYSKDYYAQYVNRNKILVANNCLDNEKIDLEIEKYREESAVLKKKLHLDDKFVLLYVGAIIKRKKVDRLLKSYLEIKKEFPDCALIIVGGGVMEEEYKNFVKENALQDVIFTGKVFEGINKYFLMSDLFILPGLGGLSIFEAMVHSLPVLSASADGTEYDLIQEDYNGYLMRTDSVEELSDLLRKFLKDRSLSKTFGAHSRKIVENKINIHNMVDTFVYAIENSVK